MHRPTGADRGAARRRLLLRCAVGLVGGAVTSLAFPPVALAPAAVLGPAATLWAAARTDGAARGALVGLVHGLAFGYATFGWLLSLDLVAYLLFPVVQAVFFAVPGAAASWSRRRGAGGWVAVTAAAWTVAEMTRARVPISGFEWGQLGLATADLPVRRGAAVVGTLGLTALLAASAAALAALVLFGGRRRWLPAAVSVVTLFAVTGAGVVAWTSPAGTLDVGIVQVDDPCPDAFALDCPGYGEQLLAQFAEGTAALGDAPDVVLWGEDSAGGAADLATVGRRLVEVAGPLERPVLVGASTSAGPGRFVRWNALFSTDGQVVGTYAKRVPVPFGEYVPLRGLLGGVSDVGRLVPTDMVSGTDTDPIPVPTDGGTVPIGTLVSWEVTFSRLARDVGHDAVGLATLTTVASYGTSAVSNQLLAAAQLRSAELQKPMAVAATTGRSAVIAADGTRAATSALFQSDLLRGQMDLRSGRTPFAWYGDAPIVVLALGALAAAAVRRRRRRNPAGDPVDGSRPRDATDQSSVDASVAR